jgi:hypothetical protein
VWASTCTVIAPSRACVPCSHLLDGSKFEAAADICLPLHPLPCVRRHASKQVIIYQQTSGSVLTVAAAAAAVPYISPAAVLALHLAFFHLGDSWNELVTAGQQHVAATLRGTPAGAGCWTNLGMWGVSASAKSGSAPGGGSKNKNKKAAGNVRSTSFCYISRFARGMMEEHAYTTVAVRVHLQSHFSSGC